MYQRIKRLVDIALAILLFPVFLALLLPLAFYITLRLKESPFFLQKRIGLNSKEFIIYKLRTMPSQKHFKGPINLSKDFVLIRSLGLDEMPQLLLILLGKMSWIGPRPLLPEYLNLYNSEQLKRHDCRPGIIGLAQLKGATRISWRHRLQYDIFYVDHLSLALDLKVLFLYLKSVGRLRDASVYNEPYNGKN